MKKILQWSVVLSLAIVAGIGSIFDNLQTMFTDVATFIDESHAPSP